MMYAYSDMECDRYSFLSFWAIFALTLLTTPKSKIKKKNTSRFHHFILVYHKLQSYDVWFLRYQVRHRQAEFFCHFGIFFALLASPSLPLNNQENQAFDKMIKTPGEIIIILHMSTINQNHMM